MLPTTWTWFKKRFCREENRKFIIFLLATTCIMLCCRNFINDQNPSNNQWVEILISAYTIFPMIIYLLICLILIGSAIPDKRPGREARGSPILVVICLIFVSLSVVLFAYLRSVNPGIHLLTIFWQTLLIMDTFALFFFFLATFIKPRGGGIGGAGETSALLLNHSDFQTLRHPCPTVNPSSIYS